MFSCSEQSNQKENPVSIETKKKQLYKDIETLQRELDYMESKT